MKQPWFKLYASDTIMDPKLQACPLEAQAIIFRMWCICHIEGSCPVNREDLAIAIRCRLSDVSRHESLIESFFEKRDNRYFSARMEKEKRRSEINRRNKVGVENKEDEGFVERFDGRIDLVFDERLPDYDSIKRNKKFLEEKAEELYKLYPRKVGKPAAIKAIISAIAKHKGKTDFLTERVVAFANSPAGNAGSFTPHPATWFNQERYNDDEREWQRTSDAKPVAVSRPNDSWMVGSGEYRSVVAGWEGK